MGWPSAWARILKYRAITTTTAEWMRPITLSGAKTTSTANKATTIGARTLAEPQAAAVRWTAPRPFRSPRAWRWCYWRSLAFAVHAAVHDARGVRFSMRKGPWFRWEAMGFLLGRP